MAGLIQAITWTTLLTLMVAVASFVPEMAFMSVVSPSSPILFSQSCNAEGLVRIPLDFPTKKLCLPAPAYMVKSPEERPVTHLIRFAKVCRVNNASTVETMMRISPVTFDKEAGLWYYLNIESRTLQLVGKK
ncbi:hypothetical protein V6N13_019638 [Hibiscus sabdariffa]|uniref:Uncharacterized protein n=1 Tax=Hibiscus sabdariffa TaxID=183260 RepID=A0ABR2EK31_9ROSI